MTYFGYSQISIGTTPRLPVCKSDVTHILEQGTASYNKPDVTHILEQGIASCL